MKKELDPHFFDSFHEIWQQGKTFVLVTVVESKGSYPQQAGARMIVTADSTESPYAGTVGGGAVEKRSILEAIKLIKEVDNGNHEKTRLIKWNLGKDLGMTCGGEGTIFLELFSEEQWKIVIFGAGHVGQSLVSLLVRLPCQIIVIDKREEWLSQLPKMKNVKTFCVNSYSEIIGQLDEKSFFISMTPGHLFDKEVLTELLRVKNPPYVGAIGSLSKSIDLKKTLLGSGIDKEKVEKIHCPIGLPFGGNTPDEVAFSIIAELLQERDRFYGAK